MARPWRCAAWPSLALISRAAGWPPVMAEMISGARSRRPRNSTERSTSSRSTLGRASWTRCTSGQPAPAWDSTSSRAAMARCSPLRRATGPCPGSAATDRSVSSAPAPSAGSFEGTLALLPHVLLLAQPEQATEDLSIVLPQQGSRSPDLGRRLGEQVGGADGLVGADHRVVDGSPGAAQGQLRLRFQVGHVVDRGHVDRRRPQPPDHLLPAAAGGPLAQPPLDLVLPDAAAGGGGQIGVAGPLGVVQGLAP